VRTAADFLEVWDTQPTVTLNTCTGIALTLHLLSAVCRSTQFVTPTSNVVTQRGSRSASCVVDVAWLKVWVQLVVKARDEVYRDAHLNSVYYFINVTLH
jgi:hypothetical protein